MGKTTRRLLAVVVGMSVLAGACGDDDDNETGAGEPSPTGAAESSTTGVAGSSPTTEATAAPGEQVDPDLGLPVDVIEAARAEGTVVHIQTMPAEIFEQLASAFEEKYGIKAEQQALVSSEALEKIRTEMRSGGDLSFDTVALGGYNGELMKREEMLAQYTPPGFEEFSQLGADPEGYWFPIAVNAYGIGVNTDVVSEGAPASWEDLASPQFDAPMLMFDPTAGSVGFTWFVDMLDAPAFGEEYLRQLAAADNIQVGSVIADNIARVARGEVGVYFPLSPQNLPDLEGTSVEFVTPAEGPNIVPIAAGLLADAPHPNAGQVWLAFLLSEEGQRILAQGYQSPIREGVPALGPEFDLGEVDPFHETTPQRYIEALEEVKAGLPGQLGF